MKDEAIKHVKEITANWNYMKELPDVIHDFHLQRLQTKEEDIYNLYAYIHEPLHRSITVYFHAETKEYKVRFKIGSFEFCYEECISASLEEFEKLLRERFEGIIRDLTEYDPMQIDTMLKETHVLEWDFSAMLPPKLNEFELFISPSKPFRITNGSYIVLDYEHFSSQSNLAVYYNIFRDEFFGDTRIAGVPNVNYEFDSQTLDELKEKLSVHLIPCLQTVFESAKKKFSA